MEKPVTETIVAQVSKTKRSQEKKEGLSKKSFGPRLAVEVPIASTRKNLSLKEPSARLLSLYAAFLTEHHGKEIDEDRVVEGLIESLKRDRAFAAWKKEQNNA